MAQGAVTQPFQRVRVVEADRREATRDRRERRAARAGRAETGTRIEEVSAVPPSPMLSWILRLVASSGLLGLVARWPSTPEGAVALALGACVAGALLALAVAGATHARELSTTPSGVLPHH